ncbi:hypothetical protein Glove_106g54 [Diversispora epigaea]|uniref:F-box domain-containing protein n=1 Tax=Diversispora epigaea TaxID=1348612 RepID=A0A397J5F1_9GLOM|nr:hypothetical protein Glove_106g54 [Diversispora epigaea]
MMVINQFEKVLSNFKKLDKEQRKFFLTALVEECNPHEIYTLRQILQCKCYGKFDIISALPLELSIKIFQQLDSKDLCHCREVNHKWKNITQDSTIWKTKCIEILALYQGQEATKMIKTPKEGWEHMYHKLYQREINWNNGKVQRIKYLKGHRSHITDAKLKGNILVTGSSDRTVRIWDLETGQCKLTLNGNVFSCVDFLLTEKVVAGSTFFRSSFIWNMETGELLNELRGHVSAVRCVSLSESHIATCAFDGSVIIWNWKSGEKIATIPANATVIRIFDTKVLSLCGTTIKAFELSNGECTFSAPFGTGLLGWSYIQKHLSTIEASITKFDEIDKNALELPNMINRIGFNYSSRAYDFDTRNGMMVSVEGVNTLNMASVNDIYNPKEIEYAHCKFMFEYDLGKEDIKTVNVDSNYRRIITGCRSGLIAILEFG